MKRSAVEANASMGMVLITGATRDPGRGLVAPLAKVGWQVVAFGEDVRVLEEMRATPGVRPLAVDITDRDAVRNTLEDIELDVLIHSDRVAAPACSVFDMLDGAMDAILEINLSATIHLTLQVIRGMARRKRGRVLFLLPDPRAGAAGDNAVAAAADEGVRGFARCLEREASVRGVFVEIIALEPVPEPLIVTEVMRRMAIPGSTLGPR